MTTRNRGRPQKNSISVHLHLPVLLISEIKTRYPHLMKPNSTDFRHGVLSGLVEQVLWHHLRSTPNRVQSQIVGRSETGGQPSEGTDRAGLSRDIPRAELSSGRAVAGGNESTGGIMGSPEGSSESAKLPDWADYTSPAGDSDIYERD